MHLNLRDSAGISPLLLSVTSVITFFLVSLCWLGGPMWLVAILVIAAWMPVFCKSMQWLHARYQWISVLFLLVVAQGLHFLEHLAQMIEIHLLGYSGVNANGIIGQLNTEWVHFLWNSWVLLMAFWLLFHFPKNMWLVSLFIFAIWHEIEHIYIMSVYLRTNHPGLPGLIARGGLIGGGLPITRPDLHFLYAVFEEGMLLWIFYLEYKRLRSGHQSAVVVAS